MMTTRMLPHDEWKKLDGTEAGPVWALLDPTRAEIIVVEDEGQIIGSWVLMNVLHAECLWVAPEHRRKAAVGRRLWTGLRQAARLVGAPSVVTSSLSDEVTAMLEHVGAVKIPGEHYAMRIATCQPQ